MDFHLRLSLIAQDYGKTRKVGGELHSTLSDIIGVREEDDMAIEIRGLAPLLQVFDMPASIDFSRDVLGFEVKSTSSPGKDRFDWALLTLNGVELMLNTAYEEESRQLLILFGLLSTETWRFISAVQMWMRPTRTFARAAFVPRSRRLPPMA